MNTIRTPRQGISETSRRIAEAVDDQAWQEFRVSMKGKSTEEKLMMLMQYYAANGGTASSYGLTDKEKREQANVRIRCDNYVKALARGGLLLPGCDWKKLWTVGKPSHWIKR